MYRYKCGDPALGCQAHKDICEISCFSQNAPQLCPYNGYAKLWIIRPGIVESRKTGKHSKGRSTLNKRVMPLGSKAGKRKTA
jgi:hypothetical protein